jgi:two-component system OmpR family response regulator
VKVLVVDDEPAVRHALERALAADDHDVRTAADGRDALDHLVEHVVDAVVLDVAMPGVDGLEVCRRLRAAGDRTPILMLTARDAVDDRVRGLDLGADDYMVKPFAMPELTARVRALLRRSQSHGGPRIAHGPLQLDTVARRAFLKGEPLELAAREWAVLEVLLARVEKIVSKEAIIQAVAGWGDDLSPNAIEVYVSRLRSKLEPAGIRIRTVRGFGYMLEEYK